MPYHANPPHQRPYPAPVQPYMGHLGYPVPPYHQQYTVPGSHVPSFVNTQHPVPYDPNGPATKHLRPQHWEHSGSRQQLFDWLEMQGEIDARAERESRTRIGR